MTVNYCGSCGAVNGVAAKFCRQCGADLEAQATQTGAAQPPGRRSGKLADAPAKPPLRIVSSPSNKASAQTEEPAARAVAAAIPAPPPAPPLGRPERQAAKEALQHQRAAQSFEQKQEAEAREIKQTAGSSLSRRLAQVAVEKAAPK